MSEQIDADKPHMGLTTWAAAPEGKIVKIDVSVAKNYLTEKEMRSLERIVSVIWIWQRIVQNVIFQ